MNAAGVLRFAAFADGGEGGNPAGVWLGQALPPAAEMQRIAAEVGCSETAFAAPEGAHWRVRYFSPESEVPFCGHATKSPRRPRPAHRASTAGGDALPHVALTPVAGESVRVSGSVRPL